MVIQVYSKATDGEKYLSANFQVKEFACKDGTDPVFVDEKLVTILQTIRDHFGKAVKITSGYRTVAYNKRKTVGGATYSQHIYGRAADIQVSGTDVESVAAYAETLLSGTGGIGRYPKKSGRAKGWVHIDTRTTKSRWTS